METKGVRMPPNLVRSIENWASGKPHIESFSQAVRVLCQLGFVEEEDRREAERWKKWQNKDVFDPPDDQLFIARNMESHAPVIAQYNHRHSCFYSLDYNGMHAYPVKFHQWCELPND